MQTRSSDENSVCPSLRLSVHLSVKRVLCDKTVEISVQIFIPRDRAFSLVFWEVEWLVGGDPFYVKFRVSVIFFARWYGWVPTSEKRSKIGDFVQTW